MPGSGPSTLSLIAAGLYVAVAMACGFAMVMALRNRQQPIHWKSFAGLAVLFVAMAVLRLLDFEDMVRDQLRDWLLASDNYESRRGIQGPIVLVIIALATAIGSFWIYRKVRAAQGRRNYAVIAAQTAGLAMIGLIAFRTVSFSALDKLLFGTLKLNWIIDIGCSGLVAACAIYYVWVVRKPQRSRSGASSR
ncbi:MAG: hypothetical protein AAFQ27_04120 [Pseudomonadota bacterium]